MVTLVCIFLDLLDKPPDGKPKRGGDYVETHASKASAGLRVVRMSRRRSITCERVPLLIESAVSDW